MELPAKVSRTRTLTLFWCAAGDRTSETLFSGTVELWTVELGRDAPPRDFGQLDNQKTNAFLDMRTTYIVKRKPSFGVDTFLPINFSVWM